MRKFISQNWSNCSRVVDNFTWKPSSESIEKSLKLTINSVLFCDLVRLKLQQLSFRALK